MLDWRYASHTTGQRLSPTDNPEAGRTPAEVETLSRVLKHPDVVRLVASTQDAESTMRGLVLQGLRATGLGACVRSNLALAACAASHRRHVEYLVHGYLHRTLFSLDDPRAELEVEIRNGALLDEANIAYSIHYGPYIHLIEYLLQKRSGGIIVGDERDICVPRVRRSGSIIEASDHPVRRAIHLVRSGRLLVLCGDKTNFRCPEKDREVTFLGRPLRVNRGIGYLAAATEVRVVLAIASYDETFSRMRIECESVPPELDAIYNSIEQHVRRDPAQWDRWKYYHRMSGVADAP